MSDFWDELRQVERASDRIGAGRLTDNMISSSWESLSYGDSINFFNELLRLEEMFPGLLAERSVQVLAKIRSDSRRAYRQDQMSKADILHKLADGSEARVLVEIAHDGRQDLETRNAAIRELWESPTVEDLTAVQEARNFLRELLERCDSGERDPAPAFAIGIGYRLLRFRACTNEDETLIERVYRHHGPAEPLAEWFRTQSTMAGLLREPKERG